MYCRLTGHFLVQVGQGELRKQWTWEPRMAESLILSLVDPNDVGQIDFLHLTDRVLVIEVMIFAFFLSFFF